MKNTIPTTALIHVAPYHVWSVSITNRLQIWDAKVCKHESILRLKHAYANVMSTLYTHQTFKLYKEVPMNEKGQDARNTLLGANNMCMIGFNVWIASSIGVSIWNTQVYSSFYSSLVVFNLVFKSLSSPNCCPFFATGFHSVGTTIHRSD